MTSFNFDLTGMVSNAADFFNGIQNLGIIIYGLFIGFNLFAGVLFLIRGIKNGWD